MRQMDEQPQAAQKLNNLHPVAFFFRMVNYSVHCYLWWTKTNQPSAIFGFTQYNHVPFIHIHPHVAELWDIWHCTKWSFWLTNEGVSIWQDLCWSQYFRRQRRSFHLKQKVTVSRATLSVLLVLFSWEVTETCSLEHGRDKNIQWERNGFLLFAVSVLLLHETAASGPHCLMAHLTCLNSIQTMFLKQWLLLWYEVLIHWCWSMQTQRTREKFFSSNDKRHLHKWWKILRILCHSY